MKLLKSHFTFTKKQKNGIYCISILIILVQAVYYFSNFTTEKITFPEAQVQQLQKEIDSLRLLELEKQKPKIFPFNPNFITDYKGYTLGMSNIEIDRLLNYRAQGKWVNSAKEFQQVTKVSDSLLQKISVYFKFPIWVAQTKNKSSANRLGKKTPAKTKSFQEKIDLNKAKQEQLERVYGIGPTLAKRILAYRTKNKGFISTVELQEIYGLQPEVITAIQKQFELKTPRKIKKINLNLATQAQLVTIPYIDYEIAFQILEQRTLREGFKSIEELKKVKDFPQNKFHIIALYLKTEN